MAWYDTAYRRHLCDMHIDEWDKSFLVEFSPERYYENLKKAHIQAPMLYFQSHVGLCYYPTKTGRMHQAFKQRPDAMRQLVELCRQGGMSVVGYYSLNFNNWAHDEHPDWRMVTESGVSRREGEGYRYGLCCPNNPDYRRFVYAQIAEMLEYFVVEGMFYDMLYWPHPCYCKHCRVQYKNETGMEIPSKERHSAQEWRQFTRMRERWMGDWAAAVTAETKRLNPQLTVEHNFSASCNPNPELCCTEGVNRASDYTGGDLYGGVLEQSFTCKFYRNISNNQPFEYMTGRCDPNLRSHTVSKTHDRLEQATMLTCAHHGATLFIDAIDPCGTMDNRAYELMGRVFEREMSYEPYLDGDMVEDVGLYYSLTSKENLQDQDGMGREFLSFQTKEQGFTNHTCVLAAMKTLVMAHIPVGVTNVTRLDELNKYKAVILPNPNNLPADAVDALIAYVDNGGALYFSNCDETRLFHTLTGGNCIGYTDEDSPYIAPTSGNEQLIPGFDLKYPLPAGYRLPKAEGFLPNAAILATVVLPYTSRLERRFASIHSDPPGRPTALPALVACRFGKGKVIWSAAPLELFSGLIYRGVFLNLLELLTNGEYTLQSDAPASVELVSFQTEDAVLVSAVQLTEDEVFSVLPPFTVTVRTNRPVKSVARLPESEPVNWSEKNGRVTFQTKSLRIADMYKIQYGGI